MQRFAILGSVLFAAATLAPLGDATHADGVYDMPLFFTWDRKQLDVVVVPPEHGQVINGNGVLGGTNPNELNPCTNSYTASIRESILDWNQAIQTYAPTWLKNGLVLTLYIAGCDGVPSTASLQPDIVIITDQTKGSILGFAANTRPCLVDNSKFFLQSFTYEDMYNVNGQEYGHCLGLGHVGGNHPSHDTMDGSYDDPVGAAGVHKHCVSNLDITGLSGVFATAFGQPGGGQPGTLPVNQYQKIAC